MEDSPPQIDHPQNEDHGSSSAPALAGILISLALNLGIAAAIVAATWAKSEEVEAAVETDVEVFQCRYIEEGRLHQLEMPARDWQEAEEKVCGATWTDVTVPPTLARGYSRLIPNPGNDGVLKAQRESCSCSDSEMVPVMQDVSIVEAPRLGTEKKRKTLPEIVNNPQEKERNAVNPDVKPERVEKRKPKEKDRDKPDLSKLTQAMEADSARPLNQRTADGTEWGSSLSNSATGRGDVYLQKVKARLDNNMNAPSSIPKSELKNLRAKIWVKIGENGRIWGWDFVRKSGNTAYDAMISRTMKRFKIGGSLSFPTPPPQWKLKRITIGVDPPG